MDIIILAGVVFLLFTIVMGRSAQKKQAQRQNQIIQEMKAGDWVMTQSGFYGKFVEIDGEVVILENEDGVESYWSQAAIAMSKNPPFAQTTEEDNENPQGENENTDDEEKLSEKLANSESSLEREEEK